MSKHEISIAQAIAQAQTDSEFKAALLADPKKALQGKGVTFPAEHQVVLLVNTATDQHVVVPSQPLAEAQRVAVLPRDPSAQQLTQWVITTVQSGGALADSMLSNPVDVLRNHGAKVPQSVKVSVHRNTDSITYLALANQDVAAEADGELSEERLDAVSGGWGLIVSRAAVIFQPLNRL